MSKNLEQIILKYALANAVKFGGTANQKAVMGKIIAENPDLKSQIKEVGKLASQIIEDVNKYTLDQQKKKLLEIAPELLEEEKRVEAVKELPPLPNVERYKQVVMRLAPYPSGPLHIGNTRMVILNDEYVRRYGGKLILVFDDTIGSEEKRIEPEAYDLIREGLEWLGVKWHQEIYKSDRIPEFYKYCEQLISKNEAYVCLCEAKEWRDKYKVTGKACPHRNQSLEVNLDYWKKMLEGDYSEGEAVVRLKTGMDYPDPAVRDHIIMRISEREHPRVGLKYRVWPLLEFSWAVDDHLLGITHILRGKDLIKEDIIEQHVWKKLGWPTVEFVHYGIITFKGLKLSKSKARKLIENGVYLGWSDPRTWSLQSLRRRGIRPEAIRRAMIDLGLSMIDIEYSPEILYAVNRKMVDPSAHRYFFVESPTELTVKKVPNGELEAKPLLHPDFPEKGTRKIPVSVKNGTIKVLVSEQDRAIMNANSILRLKDLINIVVKNLNPLECEFHSHTIEEAREVNAKIIHWVPVEKNVPITVVKPDGSLVKGFGEPMCQQLKEGQLVQFERYGFCRIDQVTPQMVAFFAHN
ncbi:MAG: glutamate--tRNA ligase [Candidatus Freyarchaeota archaeon]|nr:glutamate--tRNA ligase [Candidatus Jordarchaeia archaeon]MBS7268254.1 glutamate--tRNA ligase [Candidatus Jordarchaeia archaeon]